MLLAFDAVLAGAGRTRSGARTARSSTAAALERELARRARAPASRSSESEFERGLVGVAVPVRDDGACLAALCVSGPEYRLGGGAAAALAARCGEHARELERALGART